MCERLNLHLARTLQIGRQHVVKLHDSFKLGEHLCLVQEAMHMNLRTVLKKYGGTQGIAVKAVSAYRTELR